MRAHYENSDDIPVKELAEEWNAPTQKVVSMIGVAKKSTMIFKELGNKGYVAEEIPEWIERDEGRRNRYEKHRRKAKRTMTRRRSRCFERHLSQNTLV